MNKNEKEFLKLANCPEIKRRWKPKFGDIVLKSNIPFVVTCGGLFGIEIYVDIASESVDTTAPQKEVVWLPRLSQIIEGIEKCKKCGEWILGAYPFGKEYFMEIRGNGKSFETIGSTPKLAAIKAWLQLLKGVN